MDLNAMILVVLIPALFYGFVIWLRIRSEKREARRCQSETPETKLKEQFFLRQQSSFSGDGERLFAKQPETPRAWRTARF